MNNSEKLATQGTQCEEKQNKNNSEKLATQSTQYEEKQNKNKRQYVLDTTMGKQIQNNVTNRYNDLTNILFMWTSSWTSQQGGQNLKTHYTTI